MYLLSIFLVFINFFILSFFKKYLNKENLIFLSCFNIFISLVILIIIFYEVIFLKNICYCSLWSWINFNIIYLDWFFIFDFLTVIMCFIVLLISFLVHIYSIEYMFFDNFFFKFFSYLSLFTFFMLILISSGNLIQLFLGWEGVGLSSYLLINFWHTRFLANKSAMKALIVNRVSDFALYFGLFNIFYLFKSFDIPVLFMLSNIIINFNDLTFDNFFLLLNLTCFFFFIGAMGKSAQIGLHTWLPDAMEGPTPVSALLHAATMVTAGIFLLIRLSFLFIYCPNILLLIFLIGSLTTFFAGSVGCFQNDIKKIIAYSTCSQLGYMIISCGSTNYNVALFHLFNHAFFKALLFLGAGSIIHALFDEQDIRKYGGLHKLLPITYLSFFIATFSITGLPFLTGFYSKDIILEIEFYFLLYRIFINIHFFWFLSLFSVFFTVFYSFKIIYYSFFGYPNFLINTFKIKESSFFISFSLIFLSFFSLFIGFFFKELFLGPSLDTIMNSFIISHYSDVLFNIEFLRVFYKFYPLFISLSSCLIFCYYIIFFNNFNLLNMKIFDSFIYVFYRFFNQKWFFDNFYKFIFIFPILRWSYIITFKLIDRGFLEIFGSFTFISFFWNFSKSLNFWSLGFIYHYIFNFFINILFLFFFLINPLILFKFFFFSFSVYNYYSIFLFLFFSFFLRVSWKNYKLLILFIILISFWWHLRRFRYDQKYLVTDLQAYLERKAPFIKLNGLNIMLVKRFTYINFDLKRKMVTTRFMVCDIENLWSEGANILWTKPLFRANTYNRIWVDTSMWKQFDCYYKYDLINTLTLRRWEKDLIVNGKLREVHILYPSWYYLNLRCPFFENYILEEFNLNNESKNKYIIKMPVLHYQYKIKYIYKVPIHVEEMYQNMNTFQKWKNWRTNLKNYINTPQFKNQKWLKKFFLH